MLTKEEGRQTRKRWADDVDRKRNSKEETERGRREEIERQINRWGNNYLIHHWLPLRPDSPLRPELVSGGHIRVVVMQ